MICYQCGAVLTDSFWKVLLSHKGATTEDHFFCDFQCMSRWIDSYK